MGYPFATPGDVVRQVLEKLASCRASSGKVQLESNNTLRVSVLNLPVVDRAIHDIDMAIREALGGPTPLLPICDVIVNPMRGVVCVIVERGRMTEISPASK